MPLELCNLPVPRFLPLPGTLTLLCINAFTSPDGGVDTLQLQKRSRNRGENKIMRELLAAESCKLALKIPSLC